MQKRKFKKLTIVLLSIFLVSLVFNPVLSQSTGDVRQAGTTVTREGCDITVTTYLALAFLDDSSWLNAQQLGNIWVKGMLAVWNEPDFTYGFCECPVHFEVVVKTLPRGEKCPQPQDLKTKMPGWHCIQVVSGRERDPKVGWEPVNERGNVADALETPANNGNGYGEWTTWTSGLDAAHELGHFMGLGDEYHYSDTNGDGQGDTYTNDNPQPSGKPQSIMAQTWGEITVLQEHIDEIIENTNVDCPMPECCCGNGELEDYIGEECDPKADPTGCSAGQVCDSTCHCKAGPQVTPICGDGLISPPHEECDPNAEPPGCPTDEQCIGCKCEKEKEETPLEEETFEERDLRQIVYDFLDAPYEVGLLGEDEGEEIFRTDVFDCTSLVLVSASIFSSDGNSPEEMMKKANYYPPEEVSYEARLHFSSYRNQVSPLFRDITEEVGGEKTEEKKIVLNKDRDEEGRIIDIDWEQEITLKYVRKENISSIISQIPSEVGVGFMVDGDEKIGLDIRHEGFLFDREKLVHASSKKGEVTEDNFLEFFQDSNYDGVIFFTVEKLF